VGGREKGREEKRREESRGEERRGAPKSINGDAFGQQGVNS